MENINADHIHQILQPLGIPEGLIKVRGTLIQVLDLGSKPEEYTQLERARWALVLAGWDAVETDPRTVVVKGAHPDSEFVKFMQAVPGSDAFEGLAMSNVEQKLINEM